MAERQMKICTNSLIIRKRQIRTKMRYHLTSVRLATKKKKQETISVSEDEVKKETSYTVDKNINWYCLY